MNNKYYKAFLPGEVLRSTCFCDVLSSWFFLWKAWQMGVFAGFFIHKGVQLFIYYFASHHKAAQWTDYGGFWVCGTEFCSVFLFFYLKPLSSHLILLLLLLLCGAHTLLTIIFCPLLFLLFSVYKISSYLHSLIIVFTFYFDSWIYRRIANFHPQKWREVEVKFLFSI